jgi:predicted secreted protein
MSYECGFKLKYSRNIGLLLTLLITLATFIFSLCACSHSTGNEVSIDLSYNGKQIELAAGDSLRITVFTKPPSYVWKLVSVIEENILIYESHELIPREEQQNETVCLCGRPEQEVWTFKALKSGITIHLK